MDTDFYLRRLEEQYYYLEHQWQSQLEDEVEEEPSDETDLDSDFFFWLAA